jgi:hypothetical protein
MAKYLITWEYNLNTQSNDLNERIAASEKGLENTRQFLKQNPKNDWGIIVGEGAGYAIMEGDWKSVSTISAQLYPRVLSKVNQVLSINEAEQLLKAMKEMAGASKKAAKK